MVRTQIQLTEDQARALKRLAAERRVSMATLIREGVDRVLQASAAPTWEERKRRAVAVVGKYDSGVSDLSTDHDRYLDEAFDS